jgi:transcriptional regulator with GAF, ATPase, and Fis domain
VSLDWCEEGEFLSARDIDAVNTFLAAISTPLVRAKRFHQQITFSKHLDLARKKEAAMRLVRSAVLMIEELSLASVLVPSTAGQNPGGRPTDAVEVFAVFAKSKQDALVYDTNQSISIQNDNNLLNRIVRYDRHSGLVGLEPLPEAVYIEDVMEENFSRKPMARQIDLVSLYQFPEFDEQTGQFICSVNYYTHRRHEFTEFEKRLLKDHAAMVKKLIVEESPERIEIQVLGEIEELLSEKDDSLQSFLDKILGKTSELIGAHSGTISVLKIIDGKPWLVVENRDRFTGAKSRGWMKSTIPPLPVGGEELPEDVKSLNGYCAYTARPILVNDVTDEHLTQGYYKNLSPAIRAELAVPVIHGNSVIGVINQDSFQKNYFTEEHKRILQIIASLISQKFHNLAQIEELKQEINRLRQDIEYRDPKVSSYHFGNVIGKSKRIHSLVRRIDTVVESICNRMLHWESSKQREAMTGLPCLLIQGPTGTGKEFFFNNIYSRITEIFQQAKGSDFKLPLRKTNIAAYSGELTYSELFGHKKGAFTGAEFHRQGILEEANTGVVFLDEIGDADPKTQVQLLRFLDTGVFMRLGENQPRYSRIFLIAATNKDLRAEIEKGRFREDLFQRLNALSFQIPSLNERAEDIEDLATHFLGILYQTYQKGKAETAPPRLEPGAIAYLKNHRFRGNARELKNILLRALLFRKGPVIHRTDIIDACQAEGEPQLADQNPELKIQILLDRMEKGDIDFWAAVHQPFKAKQMTRDTVLALIRAAQARYKAPLPGLAVKLGVCAEGFHQHPEEMKKFVSFKNFLYKTVRLASNIY